MAEFGNIEFDGVGISGNPVVNDYEIDGIEIIGDPVVSHTCLDAGICTLGDPDVKDAIDGKPESFLAPAAPGQSGLLGDSVPSRTELRIMHDQQDYPEGDPLGATLVTYKSVHGDFFHRFEEMKIQSKSLLRDSLQISQNDQLLSLNGSTANELDHDSIVNMFLTLPIGEDITMEVANHRISTNTLRHVQFKLSGYKDEAKEDVMIRVSSQSYETMSLNRPRETEIAIHPWQKQDTHSKMYLTKDLNFSTKQRGIAHDKTVHFVRRKDQVMEPPNYNTQTIWRFKQKSGGGYLVINEPGNGQVGYSSSYDNERTAFSAKFDNHGKWNIQSRWNDYYLTLDTQSGKLQAVKNNPHHPFYFKDLDCKDCMR